MATSLDDLTYALRVAAAHADDETAQSNQARPALRHFGRALARLTLIGLANDDRQLPRETVMSALAQACAETDEPTVDRSDAGQLRVADLAGALADAAVIRGARATNDERWAIASHIAIQAHTLVSFVPERLLPSDLRWVSHTAREAGRREAKDPAPIAATAVLDRAVPGLAAGSARPADGAAEAMAALAYHLEDRRVGSQPPVTLWEAIAVANTAQSVSQYAAAVTSVLDKAPAPRSAADAWTAVRGQLFPFAVGRAPIHRNPALIDICLSIHDALRDTFGSPDDLAVRPRLEDVRALQRTVGQLPQIADSLDRALTCLANCSELHARADRLPHRDNRIEFFLDKRPTIADELDLVPTKLTLHMAAGLTSHLALSLNSAAGGTIEPRQSAALAERVEAGPPIEQLTAAARWHAIALSTDARLTTDPDWPQLAWTMQEIHERGRDVTTEVGSAMQRGQLPANHAARTLELRLQQQVKGLPQVRRIGEDNLPLPSPPAAAAPAFARAPQAIPRQSR